MSSARPLRVLALAMYPQSAPSTRIRVGQFIPHLAELGVSVTLRTFLDEERYRSVRGRREWPGPYMVGALVGLARTLRAVEGADLVWVQRGVAPGLDAVVLRALGTSGKPVVFDFDDAVFLPQEGGRPWVERLRRPGAVTRAWCQAAALALPGNAYLAAFARDALHGHDMDRVRILPTVVDADALRPPLEPEARGGAAGGIPTLGWVGTDTTVPYLEELAPALAALARRVRYRLLVVAGRRIPRIPGVELEVLPWTPAAEVEALHRMDLGLYPLADTPWARGKCGYKALQYLACGVPCVASPVGVLPDIVVPGVTGLLAASPYEWVDACAALLADRQARARMGLEGRALVEARYSVRAALPTLEEALRRSAEEHRG